jgi:hypothetical protein
MREATRGYVRGTVSTAHAKRREKSERIASLLRISACLHRHPPTCAHSHRLTGSAKRVSWSGRGVWAKDSNSVATRGCCTHRGSRVSEKQERKREFGVPTELGEGVPLSLRANELTLTSLGPLHFELIDSFLLIFRGLLVTFFPPKKRGFGGPTNP